MTGGNPEKIDNWEKEIIFQKKSMVFFFLKKIRGIKINP